MLSVQDSREVVEGTFIVSSVLRQCGCLLRVLCNPFRARPTDLDDQIDLLPSQRLHVEDCSQSPGQRWFVRDHLVECERERFDLSISSKLQLVPLLSGPATVWEDMHGFSAGLVLFPIGHKRSSRVKLLRVVRESPHGGIDYVGRRADRSRPRPWSENS